MMRKKIINYLTGKLPNSKSINISDFCLVLEINIWLDIDTRPFRYLHGSYTHDYNNLISKLSDFQIEVIWNYLWL